MNYAAIRKLAVIIDPTATVYDAPESVKCLNGAVYDHPHKADGERVITSRIIDVVDGKVRTANHLYELGEINPEYEKAYPGARERILNVDRR